MVKPSAYRLALVGEPVEHSLSPLIHNAALEMSGLEGEYIAITGGIADLERLIADLAAGGLHGLNVTMPLKLEALGRCGTLTAEAASSSSVNTLRVSDGVVEGHSTDVVAFRRIFQDLADAGPLLILGGGGSAAAALAAWPGPRAQVSTRDPARSLALGGKQVTSVTWGQGVPGALVVNATPVGMAGETLPLAVLEAAAGLVDLPYGKSQTPAIRYMRSGATPAIDGIRFLATQAAAAFEWWTGVPVDSGRLESVARNA